jgi:hypothetical protein
MTGWPAVPEGTGATHEDGVCAVPVQSRRESIGASSRIPPNSLASVSLHFTGPG